MPLKTYLINKINNSKFRLNGIIPSKRLPHKQRLCQAFCEHVLYTPDQLPPKVDLRSDMTPVEDQSRIGSCTANCLAGAYEYLTKKKSGKNVDISRLFVYYNARVKGTHSQSVTDSGCSMTDAIEALEEYGTCLESIWPYDISRVNTRPDDEAYEQAEKHKIREALQVNLDLDEMKSCLAQGFPFAFGLRLFTSFDKARETGVVPMPDLSDGARQSHGSHALLAVGYSDQSGAFIVRNSWGENWGDQGYCYIPYDYITNSDLCFDAWTIRKLANDDFGQENWQFNDAIDYLQDFRDRFFDDNDDNNRVIGAFDDEDDEDFSGNRNRRDRRFQDDDCNYQPEDQYGDDSNNYGGCRGGWSNYN